jgi:hypothetical protein
MRSLIVFFPIGNVYLQIMKTRWNYLAEWLLDSNETGSLTVSQVSDWAESYPFSAPLHFLHSFLVQKESTTGRNEVLHARASAYFSNSLWFEHQMENADKELWDPQPAESKSMESMASEDTRELLFEPLHMVDYFASQGIKVSGFLENKDQISVKLKSFTEWLRTMKRIHPEKIPESIDQKEEQRIRETAEISNIAGAVVTETMAEVCLQQGLTEKAIDIYRKLSLLDPAKSAYFAGLIKKITENR